MNRAVAFAALRLLRDPRWARALVAVIALTVVFTFLGRWQLHRHEAKVARNQRITANYDAPPAPLAQVLPDPAAALTLDRQWRPVSVSGRYLPDRGVLIRNRPLNGSYGYEVVVPLRTDAGPVLLVDRGWLPGGEDFVRPDSVPAPPTGEVTVLARLRPGEPPLDRPPPAGQELRIDIARIGAGLGAPVYRAYGVLAAERPAPASAPTPLPRPDEDLGPHLAYALQWWGFAVAAFVLLGVYAVREVGRGDSPEPGPPPPVPVGAGRVPTDGGRLRPGGNRRLTDEEWEDAAGG